MIRKVKIAALTVSGLLALAPSLAAYPRVIERPAFGYYGYSRYYGPRPFWPGPVFRLTGEVKIETKSKDTMVYVDGGFLGAVGKFKKFDLRPGNHDIELRDAGGRVLLHENVAIIPGRTTKIDAMGVAG